MKLRCAAFGNGQLIPAKFTCDGENRSPPLLISDVPGGTKSLALICDDPDAPSGTFVHWVVWDMDASAREMPEGAVRMGQEGMNDFRKSGYGGPCPPRGHGTHRYSFRLYALDTLLGKKGINSKEDLERAMEGHILSSAELMGTYKRD